MAAQGFGEAVEKLRRSTVRVLSGAHGHGSGVIWKASGTVVTNAHVVGGASVRVELWDGSSHAAEVTARDTHSDLAVLAVTAASLQPVTVRESSRVRAGEPVIAVGNPLGFTGAMTTGVVHAVGPVGGLGRRSWVQAAVRLAPGNSGGPLADAEGRVLGINTMVVSRGVALAIPSDTVIDFLKRGSRPVLGIEVQAVADRRGLTGLLVMHVSENSAAERASLLIGDVLIGANGRDFRTLDDLSDALDQSSDGVLKLRFLRGDRRHEREVAIALPAARREAA